VTPSANAFGPNDPVSREEMATSLARAFRLTRTGSTTFSDSQQIAPYAMASVKAVVAAHYMNGYPDGTFKPTASVTRADAAQALFAALKDRQ
jgi:amidase